MKKLVLTSALACLLMGLFVTGCARSRIYGHPRVDLVAGSFQRSDPLYVKPFMTERMLFNGDGAGDLDRNQGDKNYIKSALGGGIVLALKQQGFNAMTYEEGQVAADALVLDGIVTEFNRGSAASRAVWGMGSGKSILNSTVTIRRGQELLTDFDIRATSGGRGGWASMGSFLDAHIEDTKNSCAMYMAQRIH